MDSLLYFLFAYLLHSTESITSGPTSAYIHSLGKMLPGPFTPNSFKVTMNLTLNQCAAECSLEYHLKKFPCYAFEYAVPTKLCLLTNVTTLHIKGGYLGLQKSPVMQFYERSKGGYLSLFQPIQNTALKKQDSYFAIFYNMTREKCALFCLLETRDTCMSFSYSESRQVCGLSNLFHTKDNGQALISSGIYDHYQYYTTWPCNATIPWNYSPKAIASPYFPYASLKDVNCHVIIEAPEGKQVDLKFSTFFTQRNICDGKQNGLTVIDGPTPDGNDVLKKLCNSDNFVNRRFVSTSGYLYIQFATGSIPVAFKAVYDFVNPDPCANSPCKNGGNCTAKDAGFSCACVPGYTGSTCETDVNDCASSPCLFGGQCIDGINSFECVCPKMLGGKRCDSFVGLCSENPCQNSAHCSPRGQNDYVCTCPDKFTGKNCSDIVPRDPCDVHPCRNNGTCHSNDSSYTCTCTAGFSGDDCNINDDDCANSPCYFNVPCVDLVDDYRCECPKILTGKRCETFIGKCSDNPCIHGNCSPLARDNYTCSCFNGWTGRNCSLRTLNFCDPDPCRHGSCRSYDNGPSCACDFDFEGELCDRRIDHCQGVNCNKGECRSLEGGYRCDCIEGIGVTGKHCNETIDHCQHTDCGTGQCINTMTDFFCLCKDGQTGKKCEPIVNNSDCSKKPGHTGTKCTSVAPVTDHCKEAGCMFGLCQNTVDGFSCICAVGFHGNLCQYRTGEHEQTSSSSPLTTKAVTYSEIMSTAASFTTKSPLYCNGIACVNGVCSNMTSGRCSCFSGFYGNSCEIFIGCAMFNPCHNGNCSENGNSYRCSCPRNFTGRHCETRIHAVQFSSCRTTPCMNNGTCVPVGDMCLCSDEFVGDRCQYVNKCQTNTCLNGHCVQMQNSVRCEITPLVGHGNTSLRLPYLPVPDTTTTTTAVPVQQRSDIQCLPDSIRVYLPQKLIPRNQNVTWREESCPVTFNVTHYTDTIRLSDCGTTVQIEENFITFSNDLIVHKADDTLTGKGDLTFGEDYETVIPVKCIYAREKNVTSGYAPIKQHVRFMERRYGQLDLSIEQYQTAGYKTLVPSNGYPRKVPLNDDIYLRVGLNFPAKDLRVKVNQCIATATPSPTDANWHQLIKLGCPISPVRLLSNTTSQDVKFSFKAFDFRHNSTGFVYIHCEVTVCSSTDANCMMGCSRRTKRATSVNPFGGSHLLSTGPFVMEREEVENGAVTSTLVFAGVCLSLAVICVGIAILGWTRKSPRPHKVDTLM